MSNQEPNVAGWEVTDHPDGRHLTALALGEGGALICYDDSPLTTAELRELAGLLLRRADKVDARTT